MGAVKNFFKQIASVLPEIEQPKKKIPLKTKLIWSGVILILYLIMGEIPLYGVRTGGQDPLQFLRIIFASTRGTLLELGIGPIVTAGLIMQLLAGAEIIKFDFKDPEERGIFTAATKFLTIIVTIVEAAAMISSGFIYLPPNVSIAVIVIIFIQLVVATMIVMLMDELVQKGWGLGSGISLFIAAGVAKSIFVMSFSPLQVSVNGASEFFGAIPFIIQKILQGDAYSIFIRPHNYPSLLGLIVTLIVMFVLIYTEGMRIEIPISHADYRGIRGTYPVKLLYVSNIPIILASTLIADMNIFAGLLWSRFNPNNQDPFLNLIIQMKTVEGRTRITGGLLYYLTAPNDLFEAFQDPIRAFTYVVTMIILAIIFAVVWVEVGGLSSEKVAEQLIDSGMQIPGFRRRVYSINLVLSRYIPLVTIIGGFFVGVIAGVAQLLGVFGSGMGILLMVDILMNYYQLLVREQFEEYYPSLAKLVKV